MSEPVTNEQLRYIYPNCPQPRVDTFLPLLNATLVEFGIDTPHRVQYFLAQVGHESAELRYTAEIASGVAYEGRSDLGNTHPGDGVRYKGRGLIQLTGRANYALAELGLDLPLIEHPELLEQYGPACRSAGWFWKNNNLNVLCDVQDFLKLTKKINGGTNGLASRQAYLKRAQEVIK